jgi:hypothetical protein
MRGSRPAPLQSHWISPRNAFLATVTAALILSAFGVCVFAPELSALVKENQLLENLQVALLLGAALLQLRWVQGLAQSAERSRTLAVLLAYLCLACALREVEIDRLGDARIFKPLETVLRGATLAGLVFFVATNRRGLRLQFQLGQSLRDPVIGYAVAAVLLYCLSWPLDKQMTPLDAAQSVLLEEWFELWACTSFLAAACVRRGGLAA